MFGYFTLNRLDFILTQIKYIEGITNPQNILNDLLGNQESIINGLKYLKGLLNSYTS